MRRLPCSTAVFVSEPSFGLCYLIDAEGVRFGPLMARHTAVIFARAINAYAEMPTLDAIMEELHDRYFSNATEGCYARKRVRDLFKAARKRARRKT
jgi:hypothetical protein